MLLTFITFVFSAPPYTKECFTDKEECSPTLEIEDVLISSDENFVRVESAFGSNRIIAVYQESDSTSIRYRVLDHSFSLDGSEVTIETGTNLEKPQIGILKDNQFVICWKSDTNLKIRFLTSYGVENGGLITVGNGGGSANYCNIAPYQNGDFMVLWGEDSEEMYARVYDNTGSPKISITNIASDVNNHPVNAIALDSNNNVMVSHRYKITSPTAVQEIRHLLIDRDTLAVVKPYELANWFISDARGNSEAMKFADDSYIISWDGRGQANVQAHIYSRIFKKDMTPIEAFDSTEKLTDCGNWGLSYNNRLALASDETIISVFCNKNDEDTNVCETTGTCGSGGAVFMNAYSYPSMRKIGARVNLTGPNPNTELFTRINPDVSTFGTKIATFWTGTDSGFSAIYGSYYELHPNVPTVSEPLEDQTFESTHEFEYIFNETSFTDPESMYLNYKSIMNDSSSNLPSWIVFDEFDRKFSGTAFDIGTNCSNSYLIKVIATTVCNRKVSDVFNLIITSQYPVRNFEPENQAFEYDGVPFSYTLPEDFFTDPENQTLTLSAVQSDSSPLPGWLNWDGDRTFSGNTKSSITGCSETTIVRYKADDVCGYSTYVDFNFVLHSKAPYVNKEIEDKNYQTGEIFEFSIDQDVIIDPEIPDNISYYSTLSNGNPLPSWIEFNGLKFNGTTPSATCGGEWEFKVIGTDDCGYDNYTLFKLTTKNQPPEFQNPIPDMNLGLNEFFEYQVPNTTFYEPNEENMIYTASLVNGDSLPQWIDFDSPSRTFTGTSKGSGCNSSIEVTVKVSDNCELNKVNTSFIINTVNYPPIVNGTIENKNYSLGESFDFIFGKVFDESEPMKIVSKQSNGDQLPTWLRFISSEERYYGSAPNKGCNTIDIDLFGYDSCENNFGKISFSITLLNDPPFGNLKDKKVKYNESFEFDISSFTDPDGESLDYKAQLKNGEPLPLWLTFEFPTFSGIYSGNDTKFEITILVEDSCFLAKDDFKLTIYGQPDDGVTGGAIATIIIASSISGVVLGAVGIIAYRRKAKIKRREKAEKEAAKRLDKTLDHIDDKHKQLEEEAHEKSSGDSSTTTDEEDNEVDKYVVDEEKVKVDAFDEISRDTSTSETGEDLLENILGDLQIQNQRDEELELDL